jgi:hypothetical protein
VDVRGANGQNPVAEDGALPEIPKLDRATQLELDMDALGSMIHVVNTL